MTETFKAGRDVDAIAIDLPPVRDHFAQIDANAELNLAVVREVLIACFEVFLDSDRARERI